MLGRSDVRCTAKGNRGAEGEDAALGGDIIPLIDRDVYYAASEMQLLENGIRKFNGNLTVVIGADNNSTSRRKEGKAVWEETKEFAKKKADTALLQELNIVDWAQATNE
jgi:hypothetical protein